MSIHFAASRRPARSPLARCLMRPQLTAAANDNGRAIADNALLRATLLHFAEHGLGAARQAGQLAGAAHDAGDADGYRHWMAVCRTLDRRMAARSRRG